MTRKTRLRKAMFEATFELINYVNEFNIEQKDIQAIIFEGRKYVLFYWEEVLDYDR